MPPFEYRQAEEVRDALRELGFALTPGQSAEIVRGKDFVQQKNGPFDIDLVFVPDGIEPWMPPREASTSRGFRSVTSTTS